MTESQYLVLLRGINVGGNNIIKMVDLKACFESMGFTDVITYIQSGNVVFRSAENDKAKLTTKIESVLSATFSYESRVVTVTHKELKKVVEDAPKGFGNELDKYRCDVIFLKQPLTVKEAMKNVRVREGVDNAYAGKTVLYFSRLISRASQSYLTKIIPLPMYQNMTIRNWNTTTKLLALMEVGNEKSKPKEGK
jgi:uncharacterized protein (DUF1697 family)